MMEETTRKGWWRLIYRTIGALLVVILIGFIVYQYPIGGDDFGVYCAASDAFRGGEDPYDISVLLQHGTFMPFHYPPFSLPFFGLICHMPGIPVRLVEYVLYAILTMGTVFVLSRMETAKDSIPYAVVILLSGYLGISWSFTSGNIGGMVFVFLSSLMYYTLEQRHYYHASLLMGLMAAFTLFPLLFSSLLLLIKDQRIDRRTILLPALGAAGSLLFLSWVAYPGLFLSYLGRIAGEKNPVISEIGGFYKPTLYAFLGELQASLIGENVLILGGIVAVVVIVVGMRFIRFYREDRVTVLEQFSFGSLVIFLLLPHLKPYYFTLPLIPTYILFKDSDDRVKAASLAVVSLLPMALTFIYRRFLLPSEVGTIILSYNQILAVILVLVLANWYYWKRVPDRQELRGDGLVTG